MEFVPGYRAANAPKRAAKKSGGVGSGEVGSAAPATDEPTSDAMSSKLPSPPQPATPKPKKSGNGHGPRLDPDTAKPFEYVDDAVAQQQSLSDATLEQLHSPHQVAPEADPENAPTGPQLRLAIVADPLSQQGTNLQADAPACDVCGSITVRSGTCYKCLNCGNSMGCS
jgi:hypothetical protein